MNSLRTIWLVNRRELRERATTRGYLIGTAVTLLIVVAAVVLPTVLGGDGPAEVTVGVVGTAPAGLAEQVEATSGEDLRVEFVDVADRDAAVAAIEAEEVDAVLDGAQLLADGTPDAALQTTLQAGLQQVAVADGLSRLGVDPDEVAAALAAPVLEPVDVTGEAQPGDAGWGLAFFATILLFIGIQTNGATLLSASLEEKSSRVVEVLLSVARPWQLLAGKLLALSILALLQIGLTVAAALGANAVVGAFEVPPATGALVAVSLLMLVVGFLFYASLYAVAGSMASSLEDAQSTSGPLTFAVMGAYFAGVFVVLPSPSGTVAQVLTFVPPTAPFVVPARMALGAIPAWQIAAATVVTLVATVLVVRLAGRLYAGTLLAGGKLTWGAAFRAEPVR